MSQAARPTDTQQTLAARAELERLLTRAHNRTPPGIPLDEWRAMRNAQKRQRRKRREKGKR